ncbi:MAG: hypothetical protein IJM59_03605 [Proteobacteria bacterium]|nr:hypothetical protein [Pseudomonadota bacterium]
MKNRNHFPTWLFITILAVFGLNACDDESGSSTNAALCDPACTGDQECVEGQCQPKQNQDDKTCVPECGENEECVSGECKPKQTQDNKVCDPACSDQEECVNGECKPKPEDKACSPECGENEECINGECKPKPEDKTCVPECGENEECDNGECKPKPEDKACSPECGENEECVSGECKPKQNQDDSACNPECSENEECIEGECEPRQNEGNCEPECSEGETCTEGICKCGDDVCESHQHCVDGSCQNNDDDTSTDICNPACTDDMICIDGECQPDTPEISCVPECKNNEICNEGTCEAIKEDSCDNCLAGETCVNGACLCGSESCKDTQICQNNKCVLKDPCEGKTCPSGQICLEGSCKTPKVSLNDGKKSLDVYLSSKRIVTATKTTTKKLTWTLDGIAADKNLSDIICMTSDKKFSKTIKPCIVYDDNNKTEKVTFIGLSRKPKTKELKVVDAQKNSAELTLNLKPYFGMDYFIKLPNTTFVYRNGVAPGPFMTVKQYEAANDNKEGNLCGKGNNFCVTSFNEEETAIFDADMYSKYIRPRMLKRKTKDGTKYYGTRASVVAAARFLILQFPYDIPYVQGGTNHVKAGRGHYIWAHWAMDGTALKKQSDAQVFGLNLTKNDYNASLSRNSIRDTAIPWGAYDSSIPYANLKESEKKKRNGTYKFNGLECSGFVTWALKNGRLNLGDWSTKMFARNGSCIKNGKIYRNYKCATHVNQQLKDITPLTAKNDKKEEVKLWSKSASNKYNELTSAFDKLSRLKDSDFVQLNCSCKSKTNCSDCESKIQKIFNKAKAGDLLWKGGYIKSEFVKIIKEDLNDKNLKYKDLYNNGHIAMIIGLKRDKNKNVIEIEVGEAVGSNGNKLRKWTIPEFVKESVWVTTTSSAMFLIKMDNVYNYYSNEHNEEIEYDKDTKSDCPDNVNKLNGNCYKYTEMYNEEFNKIDIRRYFK